MTYQPNTKNSEKSSNNKSIPQPVASSTNVSRTHDSFFPKIKNSFEMDQSAIENLGDKKSNSSNNTSTPLPANIRLEDGISTNLIKCSKDIKVKNFFHVPSFEIYTIKVKLIVYNSRKF